MGFQVINSGGSYAFFMESTSIAYLTERNCDLLKIGGNLDAKSYGIALPQGNKGKITKDMNHLCFMAKDPL